METKTCPKCGKRMIRRYRNYALATYPLQRPWDWWCGCGYGEEGGVERELTLDEMAQREWEMINDVALPAPPA